MLVGTRDQQGTAGFLGREMHTSTVSLFFINSNTIKNNLEEPGFRVKKCVSGKVWVTTALISEEAPGLKGTALFQQEARFLRGQEGCGQGVDVKQLPWVVTPSPHLRFNIPAFETRRGNGCSQSSSTCGARALLAPSPQRVRDGGRCGQRQPGHSHWR